jgi:hypothetical protein
MMLLLLLLMMMMMMRGLLPWPPIHYPSPLLLHRTRKPQGHMPPWSKQIFFKKNPSNEIASFTPPHSTTNPISARTTTTHETNIQTDKDYFV